MLRVDEKQKKKMFSMCKIIESFIKIYNRLYYDTNLKKNEKSEMNGKFYITI